MPNGELKKDGDLIELKKVACKKTNFTIVVEQSFIRETAASFPPTSFTTPSI
jgi:hypothetical protein